jgi:cytochrome c biogenesis protein CcmG/thiol:disulfide interchange protein DsbE
MRADDGSRTRDLELGKLALYQLSYVRAGANSRRRKRLFTLPVVSARTFAVVLAVLAVVGLLTYGLVKKGGTAVAVGDRIPAATTDLPRLEGGGEGSLADYEGRWVLVNVWASWCTPCQTESPVLERFYDAHKGRAFTILGIDSNDLSDDAVSFIKRYDITYPQIRDGNGDYAKNELGTTGVPESFLVNPQGRLVLHSLGPVTDRYLEQNVAPYLEGRAKQ